MEPLAKITSSNIRRLRSARKWTQSQAAEHCGMPFTTYQGIEYAHSKPDASTICALARGFGVTSDEILGLRPPPQYSLKDAVAPELALAIERATAALLTPIKRDLWGRVFNLSDGAPPRLDQYAELCV